MLTLKNIQLTKEAGIIEADVYAEQDQFGHVAVDLISEDVDFKRSQYSFGDMYLGHARSALAKMARTGQVLQEQTVKWF